MFHVPAPGARLQQQPRRFSDRQQQQSGSREFQPRQSQAGDGPAGQMGESGYEGTRRYEDNIRPHLRDAGKSDAEAAKPAAPRQAKE
jgi:hypothetical protein